MGVLQPLFCVRMEPALLHPHLELVHHTEQKPAVSAHGEALRSCWVWERACELLCALACHMAVLCVGTSGASQFLSASLGGREVRGRAANTKNKPQLISALARSTLERAANASCSGLRGNVAKHETHLISALARSTMEHAPDTRLLLRWQVSLGEQQVHAGGLK